MRVLMTTKAGAGHFGPLIPFARAFQRAGADVLDRGAPRGRRRWSARRACRCGPSTTRRPRSATAIFDEVRGKDIDGLIAKRIVGDVFARIDARAAFPGVLAACRAWGPDVVDQRDDRVRRAAGGRGRRRAVGVRGHLPAGQGGAHAAARPRRGRGAAGRASAWRPTPPASACSTGPYFTLVPAALEDPATPPPRRRAALPRGASRRPPPHALRRPGRRPPAGLRHLRLGGAAPWSFFPGLYRDAIDALAPLPAAPAGDRRARPRSRRPRARCPPTCASSAGCRRPTSCRTWRRWSATAARAR